MIELRVPSASGDTAEHADWLELHAIVSNDAISSPQDLATVLKRAGSTDAVEDYGASEPLDSVVEHQDESIERIADDAFETLGRRRQYLGDSYPFSVNGV